ncbi:MAG: ribbon-helix-helix domain-containing protein, partial [Waterburya sp.]
NKPNIQTSATQTDNSNSNVPASKHTDVQPSKKAKSVNPDYTRTTVYLPKKMHKKLKAIALDEEKEMSSILEELIETWLSSRK